MQQSNDPRSADPYLTWQDLLEDEADGGTPPGHTVANAAPTQIAPPADDGWPVTGNVKLPPDVAELLTEKERLEDELKRLTGVGEPRPEDLRLERMYPVKVHTKESRIEERRLRQHDEQQRLRKQRVLEAKLAKARQEQRQAEQEAERRRKAIESALAAVREQERLAEREAEQLRKEIEQATVHARWAGDRQKALVIRAQARRREALTLELRLSNRDARQIQRVQVRKQQQDADVQKERVQRAWTGERYRQARRQTRADAARRSTPPGKPRDDMQDLVERSQARRLALAGKEQASKAVQKDQMQPLRLERYTEVPRSLRDAPGGASQSARLDALPRFYQKKKEALAWEQAQERLRQDAIERRREVRALSERLDGRGKNKDRFASTA